MGRGKKQHFIYKIHFLCGYPTGRYYLGKHTGYINDTYAGSGKFCTAYYKKYGKLEGETYIKEIIEINPSEEINREREKIIIGDLWNTDPLCMNLKPGGKGGAIPGHSVSETTRKKLIAVNSKPILQYDYKGEFVREWESATVAGKIYNIQANDIGRCCLRKINIFHGFIWRFQNDPLTEQELSKLNTPEIVKIDLAGDIIENYCSAEFAANINKITIKNVLDCCNLKRPRVNNFTYRFWKDVTGLKNVQIAPVKGRKRKVNCYDKDGNFIETYSDIKDAARKLAKCEKTGYKNIMACCKGDYKSMYGYKWKYVND